MIDTHPTTRQGRAVGGPRAWGMLVLLTGISAVSMLDRQVITILAVDIKRDLGLQDAEIGMIYGTVFSVFYALFAIPLGRLADGWIRTRQIAGSLATWSLATIGCGLAGGFGSLAAWRSVVAAGESGAGPASSSMIADLFPRSQRGIAFAILMSAATLGLGLSTLFGGLMVGWWNGRFISGIGWFGLPAWRATFIAAAVPGLILTVIILLVREPRRGVADDLDPAPVANPIRNAVREFLPLLPGLNLVAAAGRPRGERDIGWLLMLLAAGLAIAALLAIALTWATPAGRLAVYGTVLGVAVTGHMVQSAVLFLGIHAGISWTLAQRRRDPDGFAAIWRGAAYPCLLIIASAQLCMAYGFNAFAAPYAIQTYGVGAAVVGREIGLIIVLCGFSGTIVGGALGDWAVRRFRSGRLIVMLVSMVGAPPLAWIALQQPEFSDFLIWYGVFLFFAAAWYPCCMASVADATPPQFRGLATAILYLSFTILGLGIGPYAVGFVSDATGNLRLAMSWIFVVTPISLLALAIAMIREPARDCTRGARS